MSRVFAWVVALSFACGAVGVAGAQSSSDYVLTDLDTFWANQFAVAARDYWSPSVVQLAEPIETACGTLSSSFGPGAYCTANATLYHAPVWFLSFESDGLEYARITVLAHEWGHHIQLLLGINWRADKNYELQADCLSGVYARHAEQQGLAPAGALAGHIWLSAGSGDVGPLPQDAPQHGTGAERAISFMSGYESGVAGCGIIL